MDRPIVLRGALGGIALSIGCAVSWAQPSALSGDTRLACEAILCLSVATAPTACRPALARYFGIRPRKLSDLVRQRLHFLQMCPVSAQTAAMRTLVAAMAQGAGRCDADSLNAVLVAEGSDGRRLISNELPDYCSTYLNHPDVALRQAMPVYIGSPEQDGFWADGPGHAAALARYRQHIAERDARRMEQPPTHPLEHGR